MTPTNLLAVMRQMTAEQLAEFRTLLGVPRVIYVPQPYPVPTPTPAPTPFTPDWWGVLCSPPDEYRWTVSSSPSTSPGPNISCDNPRY